MTSRIDHAEALAAFVQEIRDALGDQVSEQMNPSSGYSWYWTTPAGAWRLAVPTQPGGAPTIDGPAGSWLLSALTTSQGDLLMLLLRTAGALPWGSPRYAEGDRADRERGQRHPASTPPSGANASLAVHAARRNLERAGYQPYNAHPLPFLLPADYWVTGFATDGHICLIGPDGPVTVDVDGVAVADGEPAHQRHLDAWRSDDIGAHRAEQPEPTPPAIPDFVVAGSDLPPRGAEADPGPSYPGPGDDWTRSAQFPAATPEPTPAPSYDPGPSTPAYSPSPSPDPGPSPSYDSGTGSW